MFHSILTIINNHKAESQAIVNEVDIEGSSSSQSCLTHT